MIEPDPRLPYHETHAVDGPMKGDDFRHLLSHEFQTRIILHSYNPMATLGSSFRRTQNPDDLPQVEYLYELTPRGWVFQGARDAPSDNEKRKKKS